MIVPSVVAALDEPAWWTRIAEVFDFTPVYVATVLVLAVAATWATRRFVRRVVAGISTGSSAGFDADNPSRRQARARTVGQVLRGVITALIVIVAALIILGRVGVQLAPLLAGAGVAGVALGFGAQSVVRDVLAGIFILVEDQYGIGDYVDVGPATGRVEQVTMRVTVLRDEQGTVWYVPNGEIRRAGNKSREYSRALVDVLVGHGSDVDEVAAILREVASGLWADEHWRGHLVGEPRLLGVQGLLAEGVSFRIIADTAPSAQWEVERVLRQRAREALDQAGVAPPAWPAGGGSTPAGGVSPSGSA